ncbi:uncharacterized protein LOC132273778 [Cornus florida]|uniref:uncharacterized protein LOC132273778 n=1 Tax=Cornus florida TaxID=4283 RepID=UPI00289CDB13|nr:uncharacterized protein LOC132273778 [Cornus florida]
MAKVSKVRRKSNYWSNYWSRRVTPYLLPSKPLKVLEDIHQKKRCAKATEKKEWVDATCSVCLEYPHNAVLLLCSSYNKGCRPYMCATSDRYSNCLEQYKNAYTKVTSTQSGEPWHGSNNDLGFNLGLGCPTEKMEASELLCPLCRGQVKGWTVVEPARKYLDTKRRTCMQDNCSFVGTYKELRKHVRIEHPWARPREVDPSLAEKWKRLEHERERNDVISTINSSVPGAIVWGDYVIEGNSRGFSGAFDLNDYFGDTLFRLEPFGGGRNDHVNSHRIFERGYQSLDEEDVGMRHPGILTTSGRIDNYISSLSHYHNRLLSGRSRRRRRRESASGGR